MTRAELRLLWREFTGELDRVVVPDAESGCTAVDTYLQRGAESLNRRVGYFFKDGSLTLSTGGQEAALPSDALEVVFVELGSTLLTQTDLEELKEKEPGWRQTAAGMPQHYYLYGGKIGFWPVPDAEAAVLTCTVRYLATPTLSDTPGFDLLATQDHALPVYFAASLWFEAHGQDADFARAGRFRELFETEAKGVAAYYEKRRLQRGPGA